MVGRKKRSWLVASDGAAYDRFGNALISLLVVMIMMTWAVSVSSIGSLHIVHLLFGRECLGGRREAGAFYD